MNIRFTLFAAAAVFVSSCAQQPTTMKDAAKDRFLIGTALNEAQNALTNITAAVQQEYSQRQQAASMQ